MRKAVGPLGKCQLQRPQPASGPPLRRMSCEHPLTAPSWGAPTSLGPGRYSAQGLLQALALRALPTAGCSPQTLVSVTVHRLQKHCRGQPRVAGCSSAGAGVFVRADLMLV